MSVATRETLKGFDGESTRLFRLSEVSTAIGISVQTLKAWIREGHLKVHRSPNGVYLMTRDEIRDLLKDMEINRG